MSLEEELQASKDYFASEYGGGDTFWELEGGLVGPEGVLGNDYSGTLFRPNMLVDSEGGVITHSIELDGAASAGATEIVCRLAGGGRIRGFAPEGLAVTVGLDSTTLESVARASGTTVTLALADALGSSHLEGDPVALGSSVSWPLVGNAGPFRDGVDPEELREKHQVVIAFEISEQEEVPRQGDLMSTSEGNLTVLGNPGKFGDVGRVLLGNP